MQNSKKKIGNTFIMVVVIIAVSVILAAVLVPAGIDIYNNSKEAAADKEMQAAYKEYDERSAGTVKELAAKQSIINEWNKYCAYIVESGVVFADYDGVITVNTDDTEYYMVITDGELGTDIVKGTAPSNSGSLISDYTYDDETVKIYKK